MPHPVLTFRGPIHSSFNSKSKRLESFSDSTQVSIECRQNFTNAGFFLNHGTRKAVCFYCGLNTRLDENNNPWTTHRLISPHCTYIKLNYQVRKENCLYKAMNKLLFMIGYNFQCEDFQQSPTNNGTETHEKNMSCTICLSKLAEYLYQPCSHLACCLECTTSQNICPICRADIKSRLKVYFP